MKPEKIEKEEIKEEPKEEIVENKTTKRINSKRN